MNARELFEDFSIPIASTQDRHYAQGWVNTHCPFCEGTQDFHLGYSETDHYFSCYRCGWHSEVDTIAKLLNIQWQKAKEVIKQYGGATRTVKTKPVIHIRQKAFLLPTNAGKLQKIHKEYLEGRGFNAEELEREWGLMGTGPISHVDDINYAFRIVMPYKWGGQTVSFETRDITGKTELRYIACPLERELIPHKHILYGQTERWGDTGIIVEGPMDTFRFGQYGVGVAGIKYTPAQVRLIAKLFKRVPVVFDGGEVQAKIKANELVGELKFRGVDAFRVDIKGDPGAMKQSEADYLVKQLIK